MENHPVDRGLERQRLRRPGRSPRQPRQLRLPGAAPPLCWRGSSRALWRPAGDREIHHPERRRPEGSFRAVAAPATARGARGSFEASRFEASGSFEELVASGASGGDGWTVLGTAWVVVTGDERFELSAAPRRRRSEDPAGLGEAPAARVGSAAAPGPRPGAGVASVPWSGSATGTESPEAAVEAAAESSLPLGMEPGTAAAPATGPEEAVGCARDPTWSGPVLAVEPAPSATSAAEPGPSPTPGATTEPASAPGPEAEPGPGPGVGSGVGADEVVAPGRAELVGGRRWGGWGGAGGDPDSGGGADVAEG